MKKTAFLSLAGLLAVILFPSFALARPEVTHLGLNSIDRMRPNGEYVVDTFKDGKWHEAGSLSFDRFFRERRLDLNQYFPGKKKVKIRLQQKGGGAAHIDSVFLGGIPPAAVKDAKGGTTPLRKVSSRDFDVIDAFDKGLELIFPANVKDKTLSLTARVEGKRIGKTPFQFPLKNLYRRMDEKSSFYTYRLTSPLKRGEGGVLSDEPLFKEYSRTGSGHPSGLTYGWVKNDDENLYVTIDFTPDNTADGEKDYAKVYVKTEGGLKEFKVTAAETKWGNPDFTYTDKVAYQHKVYDFKIPLSELCTNDSESVETHNNASLLLAFAAYGTARPAVDYCGPSIASDPQNNRYLVVYPADLTPTNIYGQFVNADGTPSGSGYVIPSDVASNQMLPSVAYDSIENKRFLVAWEDDRNSATTGFDIYAQLVNADGSLSGTNFVISNAADTQTGPSVAYDSVKKRFLVVWFDFRNSATTGGDIYGQLVNADGSLKGSNFIISNAADNQMWPSVAYDSAKKRFLVAWEDLRTSATTGWDIYAQLVNANGSLKGSNFVISNVDNFQAQPSVAYDSVNKGFLTVWMDLRNSTTRWDIYAQLVNANGSLNGTNFVISDAANFQTEPSVAYGSVNNQFLVAWEDFRNSTTTHWDIYAQLVNANGSLDGTNFVVSNATDIQECTAVAYNNCASFLVGFVTHESGPGDIGLALVGDPYCPEDCDNGIDDDGDGLVDCDDPDCSGDSACITPTKRRTIPAITPKGSLVYAVLLMAAGIFYILRRRVFSFKG